MDNVYDEGIKPGKYKHYKGGEYEVIGIGRHSETLEKLVIYKALYDDKKFGKNCIWIRPLAVFKTPKFINGEKVPRFKFIG